MNVKGKNALGTVDVPFDTLVKYRSMLVETANNIEVFVKKQLNLLLGTEKLMNEITADEKEQQEEFDAIYNKKEHGFVCNYEGCSEGLIYEAYEIVDHIKDKHGVEPDDQLIDGWTDKHEKIWAKAQKKKSKSSGKSLPVRWNYSKDGLNDMNMGELWNIACENKIAKEADVPKAIQELLRIHKDLFVKQWDSFTIHQKKLLVGLCGEKQVTKLYASAFIEKYELISSSHVYRAMEPLLKDGTIEKIDDIYSLTDMFFKEWIKSKTRSITSVD